MNNAKSMAQLETEVAEFEQRIEGLQSWAVEDAEGCTLAGSEIQALVNTYKGQISERNTVIWRLELEEFNAKMAAKDARKRRSLKLLEV